MDKKQAEREALKRERELKLEAKAREREDRREERMLMMLSAIIQSQLGMMPFSGNTPYPHTFSAPTSAYPPSAKSFM